MKVLTPILTVFIAINLQFGPELTAEGITANTTLAQDPTEETLRKVQETLAQNEQQLARVSANVGDAPMKAKVDAMIDELHKAQIGRASAYGRLGMDRVLLVLTDQIKAEDIAATTEDLNIMSRIFDKKLGSGYAGTLRTAGLDPLGPVGQTNIRGFFHSFRRRDGSQGTQAIYLHGYAALFLMTVDFPLSTPPKVEVEKIEEDFDPLWEGTKRELSTPGKTRDEDYVYAKYDSAKEYDAEKVQDLKTNLTKALRHAANIRNLKPDESIILAVAGAQPPAVLQEVAVKDGKTYRVIASNADMGPLFSAAPALLTIRAKKSDIDGYAKGQLDLDKFRERVKFLTSHVNLGPARAEQIQWRARY